MKLKTLLFTLSAAAIMSANAYAQVPIVIKFSHVVANDTPKGKAADRFKELAEKLIKTAFHSSLVDAIVKSKMMDINIYSSTQTYDEPITERQKSYLLELIQNVDDDEERERLMSQIDGLTKEEASNAIQSLAK